MLKILFKLNLIPCTESKYTKKKKKKENHLHVIFYAKRKGMEKKKKTFVKWERH